MRKTTRAFSGLLVAGLLAASRVHAQQDCELNGVAVDPLDRSTVQGRSGVLRCTERGPAAVVREQDLQNGRLTGTVRYFSNGRLTREQTVNDRGRLQGRSREFAPDGQLLRESTYDNGTLAGPARTYHPGKRLQRASFYGAEGELAYAEFTARGELRSLRCADRPLLAPAVDDARLCGFSVRPSQVDFMAETGALRARATFVAGRRIRYETFQDNGRPATQEELLPTGRVERIFGDDGNRRREVQFGPGDARALREREQEFSSAGTLTRERHWSQGQLASEQTYYLNGQPRSKARYTSAQGARVLETQDFYDNGVLSAEGSYIDTGRYAPTPVGTHRQFDMQGKVKSETVYDARGRLLRERNWDAAGNLLRDDEPGGDDGRRLLAR